MAKPAPGKLGCFGCKHWDDKKKTCSDSHEEYVKKDECPYYMPDDEEGPSEVQTPGLTLDDGRIIEEVIQGGAPEFAVWDGKAVKYEAMIEVNGTIYAPRSDKLLEKGVIHLPSKAEEFSDMETLISEVQAFIHKYVDFSEEFERFASWYVLLTWISDVLNTIPYLRFLGDYGVGKSRALDAIGGLCYHACGLSGAVTPAPLYRATEQWQGTMIIDEGDFYRSDEKSEIVKILNTGFERGRPVIRCLKDNPDKLQAHDTFGPKLIASRKHFWDQALESRCLTEIMQETKRTDIPEILPQNSDFYQEQERLRNKLLMFRFKMRGKIDPNTVARVDLGGGLEPRVKQVTRNFAVLFASDKTMMGKFREFLAKYQRGLIEERADTLEGQAVQAIWDIMNTVEPNAQISTSMVAERVIGPRGKKITPQATGRILSSLKIERKYTWNSETKSGERCIVWNDKVMVDLFRRYIPQFHNFLSGLSELSTLSESSWLAHWLHNKYPDKQNLLPSLVPDSIERFESAEREPLSDKPDTSDNSQREKFDKVMEIIQELSEDYGGAAPTSEVERMAASEGIQAAFVEHMLTQERSRGNLYEPKQGMIKRSG
jgi:hypothetical protein